MTPVPEFVVAGMWGLVSGSGLLLGAIVADALSGKLSHRMVSAIMGFGGGVLFAVIATELVVRPHAGGAATWPTIALPVGAGIFSGINWYLARRGARDRKRCGECVEQPNEAEHHGSGAAIAVGSVLDGIPEALVIGMSVAGGGAISLAVIVGFFLANVPQGLSSTSGMKLAGRSRTYIYTIWIGIPLTALIRDDVVLREINRWRQRAFEQAECLRCVYFIAWDREACGCDGGARTFSGTAALAMSGRA